MKANTHAFNVELATKLGDVNEVLILQHFYWWHQSNNKKKDRHKGDHPNPWTYNTIEEFCNIFPYMKKTKLNGAINRLIKKELLITGNFNKMKFDKTKWYSLTNEGLFLFEECVSSFKKSEDQNKKPEDQNENAIPYSNTDSNTDSNKNNNKKIDIVYNKLISIWPKNRIQAKTPVIKYLKSKTDNELKLIVNNAPPYLKLNQGFIKNLRNYLEHECWSEEWLLAEKTKNQKQNNKPDTKTLNENYDNID